VPAIWADRDAPTAKAVPDGTSLAAGTAVSEIPPSVRELVRDRAPSMDHIEVLMRLVDAGGAELRADEIVHQTRLGSRSVSRALEDLLTSGLVGQDRASGSFRYAPRGADDRSTVEALAKLYHQRPVTLVKLVYEQPPAPVKSFADAFRLRNPSSEE
jgi:hypothetical protein